MSNYDPNKIEFTVVSINRDAHHDVFIIRVFSSVEKPVGWRVFRIPFPPGYKWRDEIDLSRNKVVFYNGKFHWCGDRCIAAYDPFNSPSQCQVIQWPNTASLTGRGFDSMYLGAWEGRLRLGSLFMIEKCEVWELVDYANQVWVRKYDTNLNKSGLVLESFADDTAGDKAYVVAVGFSNIVQLLDLRNGSVDHFYKSPFPLSRGCGLRYLEPFVSSSWPTPVPTATTEIEL